MHPKTGFDPLVYGCRCDECPIGPDGVLTKYADDGREWRPVGPEWRRQSDTLIVGEAPADTESETGYPLSGSSGIELHGILTEAGQLRRDFSITNVIACQPPGAASGAYERMDASLRRRNNTRKKKGLPPLPHPADCCRPRLLKELSQVKNVVILGTTALRAVTGKKINITSKRGGIFEVDVEGQTKKVGATFHPAYVSRAPGEKQTVIADFGKFRRYFTGKLHWREPGILFNPSVEETAAFLDGIADAATIDPYRGIAESFCDTETNAKEPLVADLRCISAGYTPKAGLVTATCWACNGSGVAGSPRQNWPAEAFPHLMAYLNERQLADAEGGCKVCAGAGSYETDFVCVLTNFASVGREDLVTQPVPWYSSEEKAQLEAIWARYLTRPDVWKIGHNFSGYDRQALEKSPFRTKTWIGVTPSPVKDSLDDAHFTGPDLSKSLASVGSRFTDVTTWKEDYTGAKIAVGGTNDFKLGVYCCYDITVNGKSFYEMQPLVIRAGGHRQVKVIGDSLKPHDDARFGDGLTQYDIDHRAQYMAVGMHKVGLCVDEERRALFETLLRTQGQHHLKQFIDMAAAYGVKISPEEAAGLSFDDDDGDDGAVDTDVGDAGESEEVKEKDADGFFNPRSADQMRVLLYEKIGLGIPESLEKEKEFLTKTGLPAVNDSVIRAIIADDHTPPAVALGLRHYRLYKRKDGKMASLLQKFGKFRVDEKGQDFGHLWEDGAVRSSFGAFLVATKRYNSANPNMANLGSRKGSIVQAIAEADPVFRKLMAEQPWAIDAISKLMSVGEKKDANGNVLGIIAKAKLKSIFRAKPGFLLCGGDMDQLHLRIIANLFGIPVLLEAFKNGLDPHCYMAYVAFGDKFKNADGWGPEGFSLKRKPKGGTAFAMREGAKTLRYLLIYGGSADTAWKSYISVEGETGDLPYAKTSRDEVRRIRRAWMLAEPEWEKTFWDVAQREYEANGGFLLSPITNIRSGALEGGTRSAASNWKVLFFEALVARIAEHQMMLEFPFAVAEDGFVGHGPYAMYGTPDPSKIWDEGMCSQVHDFMAAQIKDRSGVAGLRRLPDGRYEDKWVDNLRERVKEALTVNIPGHDVTYSCDPGIAYSLDGV